MSVRSELGPQLDAVPIFPLPGAVLFPHAVMPLHVFEPRYRTLLGDALAGDRMMAIALVPDPHDVDADGNPRIAAVAGVGEIVEHQALPDGRSNILLAGRARVRLEELPFIPPYRRARAVVLVEAEGTVGNPDRMALVAAATAFASAVKRQNPEFEFHLPPHLGPAEIADIVAQQLVVESAARQALLEELDPGRRVQRVIRELSVQQHRLLGEAGPILN